MLFGYFYFSPFIGGEEINFYNRLRFFNKCPNCNKEKVFEGIIKLKNYCKECNIDLNADKIGDGASWITTSLICFLIVPILFYIEINIGIGIKLYIVIVFPLLLIFSIILLRVIRYILLKKYMNYYE